MGRAVGYAFKPVAWVVGKVVPPTAVEGALKGADWLARKSLFEERVFREAGVGSIDDLKRLDLEALDRLASSFHVWAVDYAIVEGGATGAAGLPGIAFGRWWRSRCGRSAASEHVTAICLIPIRNANLFSGYFLRLAQIRWLKRIRLFSSC